MKKTTTQNNKVYQHVHGITMHKNADLKSDITLNVSHESTDNYIFWARDIVTVNIR